MSRALFAAHFGEFRIETVVLISAVKWCVVYGVCAKFVTDCK